MGAVAAAVYYGLFHLTRRPFISLVIAVLVAVLAYLVLYVIVSRTTEAVSYTHLDVYKRQGGVW